MSPDFLALATGKHCYTVKALQDRIVALQAREAALVNKQKECLRNSVALRCQCGADSLFEEIDAVRVYRYNREAYCEGEEFSHLEFNSPCCGQKVRFGPTGSETLKYAEFLFASLKPKE